MRRLSSLPGMIVVSLFAITASAVAKDVVRHCRFQSGDIVAYGVVEGDNVRQIDGDLFGKWKATDRVYPLAKVKFLVPVERPMQVFAMAGNYKSHLGAGDVVTTIVTTTKVTTNAKTNQTKADSQTAVETETPGQVPTKFQIPQVFYKPPACLIATGESVVLPKGSKEVHYEAELVVVIGKMAHKVSKENALDYVFGVTCGNDVSARDWQKGDVQWWRAKGSDTFGPCGPVIVSGLNYDDLRIQGRLNGKVVQDERTSQLIHGVREMVSFLSQHVTLHPGDLIYTGTSGKTQSLKAGDTFEVEIEGVGILANPVVAEE